MALSRMVLRDGRELRIHESLDELSTELAEYIAELSEASVKERGVFSVALSGGSLIALMGKLREAPYKTTVDWPRWHIFWCDERMVSKSHADSNYKLARDQLLCKVPIVPSHVHSIKSELSAEDAANDYEFVIRQLVRTRVVAASDINDCPKFDLILLGMGSDGHVASLFPEHEALTNKDEWITFITDSSETPPPGRITFTLPVINSASNVAMVVTGANKADVVRAAISSSSAPDCALLPAKMVSPTQGKLVWFLDREAASKLRGSQIN